MFRNLISVKETKSHKIYKILGIKFKLRNKSYIKDLKQFAEIIGAKLPASIDTSIPFKRLIIQSGSVEKGDFVIYPWEKEPDDFISESIARGAAVIFCSTKPKHLHSKNICIISDAKDAVYKFAIFLEKTHKVKKICITGSIGKTTTTGLINTLVTNSFNTLSHKAGLNLNTYGSILKNLQKLNSEHKYWVQEVGGEHPGYVELSARFLRPNITVLTNISDSHLEYYKTRENVFYDKSSLERYAKKRGAVIINYDDEILKNAKYTHKVITVSIKDPKADYFAKDIKMTKDGLYFTAICKNKREISVHLNLYGDFNAYNALYAIAIGELIGLKLKNIPPLLETYQPSGMRQNHMNIGGYSIYADTYNANPESMFGTAKILEKFTIPEKGRKIFVSGQMNELGVNSDKMHKELGLKLAKLNIDLFLLYAGKAQHTFNGLKEGGFDHAIFFDSRSDLDNWIRNNLTKNDEIFFKSSHGDICLAITIDNVFGTTLTNGMDNNYGHIASYNNYIFRIRKYGITEITGYTGKDKDLIIPSNYDENVSIRISPFAFKEKSIESIVIPDSIKVIGSEAFFRCFKLKNVTLSKNLLYIDKNAFNSCINLEEIEIPENVIHIERRAFYDCKSLKKVIISEKVGFIGEDAFKNTSKDFVIICPKNSYAEKYAKENNIQVEYNKN